MDIKLPSSADLLLHTCCGPCATFTVEFWRKNKIEPISLWFNPNIHPYHEHCKRLDNLSLLSEKIELPLLTLLDYDMGWFLEEAQKSKPRCLFCFRLRLSKTAQVAKELGIDAFSTTLLISPYQDHNLLKEIGEEVSRQYIVKFLYQDLRPGYYRSRELSQIYGLYRQKYCGCLYSFKERFINDTSHHHPRRPGT